MENLEWLYKARSNYWDIPNPGLKYAKLRRIKNDAVGGYTLDNLVERLGTKCDLITRKILTEIESGIFRTPELQEKVLPLLISDLGLSVDQFDSKEKLIRPAAVVTKTEPTAVLVQPVTPKQQAKPETKKVETPVHVQAPVQAPVQTPAQTPVQAQPVQKPIQTPAVNKVVKIINHISDSGFVFQFIGNEIHILEDTRANNKKVNSVWVAPADIRGGDEVVPRTSIYERK